MIFETVSGSTYEVDEEQKKIRWVSGDHRHPVFPADGQWRAFHAIDYGIELGYRVVIFFEKGAKPIVTTPVKAIHGQRAA